MTAAEFEPWRPYPAMTDDERILAAAQFYRHLATRRTCRQIGSAPVPRTIIEAAIMAAGTAPSGANHQPWHFVAIESPDMKRQIRSAAESEEQEFYAGKASAEWIEALAPLGTDADKPYLEAAPWLIAIFAQRKGGPVAGDMKQNYYINESVGIATGLLLAALHEAGLATLTHTPNPMRFLNMLCKRPANEKPVMIIVVGHPTADAVIPRHALIKKPLEEISSWF